VRLGGDRPHVDEREARAVRLEYGHRSAVVALHLLNAEQIPVEMHTVAESVDGEHRLGVSHGADQWKRVG
jgi:hypothetical protein